MKNLSAAMKTLGSLIIVIWVSQQSHIPGLFWLAIGDILLLGSWYALDFHYFRERQARGNPTQTL